MTAAADEREQLRQLTRAAHEAAADLRTATREAEAVAGRLVSESMRLVAEHAADTVRTVVEATAEWELARLRGETMQSIKDTERAIEMRLVRLIGALIGLPDSVDTMEKFGRALDDRAMTRPDIATPVVGYALGLGPGRRRP